MKIITGEQELNIIISRLSVKEILRSVKVRLILPEEKPKWDELMKAHHYLGFDKLIGEGLRYVAVFEDYWLALIGWASAALHCGVRDQCIGWTKTFREQRLFLIANNVRYLILPYVHIPNLASRILSLNVKRLSQDWQERFNHPVVLAETFVDPRYFAGTCYRAAGWKYLGETRGFAKSARKYVQHNQPKKVWLKPINQIALKWLTQPILPSYVRCPMNYTIPFSQNKLDELRTILRQLPEFRTQAGMRHPLATIISMAICATICGARTYIAITEWAAACTQNQLKRFRARYDIAKQQFIPPSEPTFRRTLQGIDAQAVDNALSSWLFSVTKKDNKDPIAIDGKTMRGAKNALGKQVHLLSAFLHNQGVVIGQCEIADKTNEIPEIKTLLRPLDIAGAIVTADALHTQVATAKFIVEDKKADYVFTVKDNQQTLNEDINSLNLESFPPSGEDN